MITRYHAVIISSVGSNWKVSSLVDLNYDCKMHPFVSELRSLSLEDNVLCFPEELGISYFPTELGSVVGISYFPSVLKSLLGISIFPPELRSLLRICNTVDKSLVDIMLDLVSRKWTLDDSMFGDKCFYRIASKTRSSGKKSCVDSFYPSRRHRTPHSVGQKKS